MAAEIELPDGTRAIYDGRWQCSDPKAIPVLNYFTDKALERMDYEPSYIRYVAVEVVAVIVGSRVVRIDPPVYRQGVHY